MVIAFKPLIPLLPYKGSVMSSLQRPFVIYDREQRVSVVTKRHVLPVLWQTVYHRAIVVTVASVGHERCHVQLFRERDKR